MWSSVSMEKSLVNLTGVKTAGRTFILSAKVFSASPSVLPLMKGSSGWMKNQLRYFLISFRKVHPKTYRQWRSGIWSWWLPDMTILFCKAILLLMTGLSGMPLKMTTGFSMLWNLTFRINPGPTGNIIISAHIWHPLSFRNGPGNVLWTG